MSFWTLLVLGLVAGGTILIGLLLGRLRGLSSASRTALSMLAAGILIFLLIEIIGQATEQTAASVSAAVGGVGSGSIAGLLVILLLVQLQDRFRVVSYSSNHEISYLRTSVFGKGA